MLRRHVLVGSLAFMTGSMTGLLAGCTVGKTPVESAPTAPASSTPPLETPPNAQSQAPECPVPSPVTEDGVEVSVRYTLSVEPPAGSAQATMSVTATAASGLDAIRNVGKHKSDFFPAFDALVLSSGSTDDGAALAAWSDQVKTFVTACDEQATDCSAEWNKQKDGIERSATLTMSTPEGTLATWKLVQVWPIELATAEQKTADNVVVFSVSARIVDFATNDAHPLSVATGVSARWKAPELNSHSDAFRCLSPMQVRDALKLFADIKVPRDPIVGQSSGKRLLFSDEIRPPNFKLEIDGVIVGAFKEITGLESEVEIIEYKNGDNPTTQKRPGRAKFNNIVMKRGQISDASLLARYRKVLAGQTERKSGSIVYLDREGNGVRRFNLYNAEPTLTQVHRAHVEGVTDSVDVLELAVEKVERAR